MIGALMVHRCPGASIAQGMLGLVNYMMRRNHMPGYWRWKGGRRIRRHGGRRELAQARASFDACTLFMGVALYGVSDQVAEELWDLILVGMRAEREAASVPAWMPNGNPL